jgi:hypothetical protein
MGESRRTDDDGSRFLTVLNVSTAEKKGSKGWEATNMVVLISWLITLYIFVHI